MPLPSTERILLGPGPSLIPPRVMRAMAAPVLSHLDPDFVPMLDEVRASLQRVFRADSKAFTIATSGTGTSAMEAAVANAVADGSRGIVIVTGYFGDRLAQIFQRYGSQGTPHRCRVGTRRRSAATPRRAEAAKARTSSAWCTPRHRPAFAIRSKSWRQSRANMERSPSSTW